MDSKTGVRIIAGRWKGSLLEAPAGARPTSARAREALFSILQDSVPGARVLDLYAGSGALGLEALSRGAGHAVLVERHPAAIDRNVQRLSVPEAQIEILRGDVESAIEILVARGDRFDLVFSDPPYRTPAQMLVPRLAARLLLPGGLFLLQVDRPGQPFVEPAGWTLIKRRDYGRNVFLFLSCSSSSLDLPLPECF